MAHCLQSMIGLWGKWRGLFSAAVTAQRGRGDAAEQVRGAGAGMAHCIQFCLQRVLYVCHPLSCSILTCPVAMFHASCMFYSHRAQVQRSQAAAPRNLVLIPDATELQLFGKHGKSGEREGERGSGKREGQRGSRGGAAGVGRLSGARRAGADNLA